MAASLQQKLRREVDGWMGLGENGLMMLCPNVAYKACHSLCNNPLRPEGPIQM